MKLGHWHKNHKGRAVCLEQVRKPLLWALAGCHTSQLCTRHPPISMWCASLSWAEDNIQIFVFPANVDLGDCDTSTLYKARIGTLLCQRRWETFNTIISKQTPKISMWNMAAIAMVMPSKCWQSLTTQWAKSGKRRGKKWKTVNVNKGRVLHPTVIRVVIIWLCPYWRLQSARTPPII